MSLGVRGFLAVAVGSGTGVVNEGFRPGVVVTFLPGVVLVGFRPGAVVALLPEVVVVSFLAGAVVAGIKIQDVSR